MTTESECHKTSTTTLDWPENLVPLCLPTAPTTMRSTAKWPNTASSFQTKFKAGCCFERPIWPRSNTNWCYHRHPSSNAFECKRPCLSSWARTIDLQSIEMNDDLALADSLGEPMLPRMTRPMMMPMSMMKDTMSMTRATQPLNLRSMMKVGLMTTSTPMLPTMKVRGTTTPTMRRPLPSSMWTPTMRHMLPTWTQDVASKTSSCPEVFFLWSHWTRVQWPTHLPVVHLLHHVGRARVGSPKAKRAKAKVPMWFDIHLEDLARLLTRKVEPIQFSIAFDADPMDTKPHNVHDHQSMPRPHLLHPVPRNNTLRAWLLRWCRVRLAWWSSKMLLAVHALIARWWTLAPVPFWWDLAPSSATWCTWRILASPLRPLRWGALPEPSISVVIILQWANGSPEFLCLSTTTLDSAKLSSSRVRRLCWWEGLSLRPLVSSSTSGTRGWCLTAVMAVPGDRSLLADMGNTFFLWPPTMKLKWLIRFPPSTSSSTSPQWILQWEMLWTCRSMRRKRVPWLRMIPIQNPNLEFAPSWTSTGRCLRLLWSPKRTVSMLASPRNFIKINLENESFGRSMQVLLAHPNSLKPLDARPKSLAMRLAGTLTLPAIALPCYNWWMKSSQMKCSWLLDAVFGAACKQSMQPLMRRRNLSLNSDRSTTTATFDSAARSIGSSSMRADMPTLSNLTVRCPGTPKPWLHFQASMPRSTNAAMEHAAWTMMVFGAQFERPLVFWPRNLQWHKPWTFDVRATTFTASLRETSQVLAAHGPATWRTTNRHFLRCLRQRLLSLKFLTAGKMSMPWMRSKLSKESWSNSWLTITVKLCELCRGFIETLDILHRPPWLRCLNLEVLLKLFLQLHGLFNATLAFVTGNRTKWLLHPPRWSASSTRASKPMSFGWKPVTTRFQSSPWSMRAPSSKLPKLWTARRPRTTSKLLNDAGSHTLVRWASWSLMRAADGLVANLKPGLMIMVFIMLLLPVNPMNNLP